MNVNLAEIVCIIDQSGSMESFRSDAIGGFNSFLSTQKKHPGEAQFTLVLFDNNFHLIYDGIKLEKVPPLEDTTYVPRGCTALLDAIGLTVERLEKRLLETPELDRPAKVIVAILTDGEENASKKYTLTQIFELIQKKSKQDSWEFIFLAANQDAFNVAKTMSISAKNTTEYMNSSIGINTAYETMSQQISSCRTAIQSLNTLALSNQIEKFVATALHSKSSISIQMDEMESLILLLHQALYQKFSDRSPVQIFDSLMDALEIICSQCNHIFYENLLPDPKQCPICQETMIRIHFDPSKNSLL